MAETPKFKVGDKVRSVVMEVTGVNNPGTIAGCYTLDGKYIDDFYVEHLEPVAPTPLLPSTDEVEFTADDGSKFKLTVFELLDQLKDMQEFMKEVDAKHQSELASLRAGVDAEWNAGRDAAATLCSLWSCNGNIDRIRALTRPTTPSPDEAKGGE